MVLENSYRIISFARTVKRRIDAAFEDPKNKKDFEEWYERRYGDKYDWEKFDRDEDPDLSDQSSA